MDLANPWFKYMPLLVNETRYLSFHSWPSGPTALHIYASPIFNTPESDHKLIRKELHEMNCVRKDFL